MDEGKQPTLPSGGMMRLAGLGTELAGAILGGCLLGYWIDRRFETQPWGLTIGASVGIVGGLYNLIRKAVRESVRLSGRGSVCRHNGRETRRPGGDSDSAGEGRQP